MESFFNKLAAHPQHSIVILSLLLLLAGNWILPLTDRDEARFGEASREMLQRGDYVVPWFNGGWRLYKPVLIYWSQMASYRVLGVNDFAARLPSALFATATALLLVRWGRKTAEARTGFMAGAMYVAGLHVALVGRMATADLALIFFFTLATWSGWGTDASGTAATQTVVVHILRGSGAGISRERTRSVAAIGWNDFGLRPEERFLPPAVE